MKENILEYCDPFLNAPARHLKTGKIRIGLEKVKVKNNTLDVIKEDRQAFGLLVGKVQTPSEALKYPLTTVPLALVEPDQTLRQ